MRLSDRVWRRLAVVLCVAALLASALHLYAISFYNHPYYDDYGFSAKVHQVWQQTGSLPAVLRQAWDSARETRLTWQGTYTGTLLSNVQPGVFSESLYWIGSFFLLTAFLVCGWFFLQTAFGKRGLGLKPWQTCVLCCLTLCLLLQRMPDTGEAWYWFNGGVGNVFIYSLMMLFAALALRLWRAKSRPAMLLLTAALVLVAVLLGGGSYGGGLFSLCLLAVALLWALATKQRRGWLLAIPAAVLLCGFVYSMAAPGNAQRAAIIGNQVSPIMAILQSFYYGTALMGTHLSLPLVAITALVVPFFWQAAKGRDWRFDHPVLLGLLLACLYCTQLTPPLYSGVFLGGGRIMNTYFISFVVLWLLYAFYLTGWACRKLNNQAPVEASHGRLYAFVMVCVLALGLCGTKLPDDPLYGPQNLSGFSAALSIVTGEAAEYDRQMTEREALLNDASQPEITLSPLTSVPEVFLDDLLVPGATYDARPALCQYYGKEAIHLAGEEVQP